MKAGKIKVGETYRITHSRRGDFVAELKSIDKDGEWCDLLIVKGIAKAMLSYNNAYEGEVLRARVSHCTFLPAKEAK